MEGITKQPLILLNRIYQFGSVSAAKRNHYDEVPRSAHNAPQAAFVSALNNDFYLCKLTWL
jgi:hypothetical protein